jgi:hypothetical protein
MRNTSPLTRRLLAATALAAGLALGVAANAGAQPATTTSGNVQEIIRTPTASACVASSTAVTTTTAAESA